MTGVTVLGRTVPGLTYADFDASLREIGYQRNEKPDEWTYVHPSDADARIRLPVMDLSSPVYWHHLIGARLIADGFGILDAAEFDAVIARHKRTSPVPA